MKLNHEYHSTISNVTCHFIKFWKNRYMIVGCDPWWNWSLLEFQKVSLNSARNFLQSFLYGDAIMLPMVQITKNMPSKCKYIFLNRMNFAMTYMIWKCNITFVLKAILWLVNTNSNISKCEPKSMKYNLFHTHLVD
jgi:hypothetical protein